MRKKKSSRKRKINLKKEKELIKKTMNKVVYWLALLVTIIGNLIISAALIPFLIVVKDVPLYIIIATLGIAFGLLFDLLLKDIENIDVKHHIIAVIFIPGIAIINLYIITNLANRLIEILEVTNIQHNPIIISVVYIIAFMLPYAISKIK